MAPMAPTVSTILTYFTSSEHSRPSPKLVSELEEFTVRQNAHRQYEERTSPPAQMRPCPRWFREREFYAEELHHNSEIALE